jgi:hypothetical protein
MNLLPGALASLTRLVGNELDAARLIQSGDAVSPQYLGNMALFKLRVTGTGYSYRPKFDEYVYRRPENYLTQDFLERIGGLPIIWDHPDGAVLTSQEFGDRIIGAVMRPYVEGSDVMAICRIYDADAAQEMAKGGLSTSPSVVFRDPNVNLKIEQPDGRVLLVEGAPSLTDHLAVCENGVWDKGASPDGVATEPGEDREALGQMAEERMSEEVDSRLDAIADRMDAVAVQLALDQAA